MSSARAEITIFLVKKIIILYILIPLAWKSRTDSSPPSSSSSSSSFFRIVFPLGIIKNDLRKLTPGSNTETEQARYRLRQTGTLNW